VTFAVILAVLLTLSIVFVDRRRRRRLAPFAVSSSPLRLAADLLAVAALVFLFFPQDLSEPVTSDSTGPSIALVVDVSKSMEATDESPTRFDRAREEIRALVSALPNARFALLPFAGEGVLQLPLTNDAEALAFFIDGLETETVASSGSAPEEAVLEGVRALEGVGGEKAILLLTDGERTVTDPAPLLPNEIPVFVVPLGKENGIRLPDDTGGFRLDSEGIPVLTRMMLAPLRRIASSTGGTLLSPSGTAPAVAPLIERWGSAEAEKEVDASLLFCWFAFFLLTARALIANTFSRPLRLLLFVLSFVAACGFGERNDGMKRFREALYSDEKGDDSNAERLFGEAALLLEGEGRGKALYNRGTVILAQGDHRRALPLLEEAVILLPGDEEVRTNLVLALRAFGGDLPPGVGEGGGETEEEGGMGSEEALRLLESVRPDPAALEVNTTIIREKTPARDW